MGRRLAGVLTVATVLIAIVTSGAAARHRVGADAAGACGGRGGLAKGRQPAPSLFGINTGTFDSSYRRFQADMPTAKRMGARWVHLTGDNVKYDRRGRVSFKQMDCQVNRARALGLGVLMSLGGIRQACSLRPRPSNPTDCPPRTARDLRVYRVYVAKLVRHFRGRVRYYESWTEPNHASMWRPFPDPTGYARVLSVQHQALKAADRSAQLTFGAPMDFGIGDGSSDGVAVLIFTQRALDALHGARPFELAGVRPYRFPPDVGPAETLDATGNGWTHFPSAPAWRKLTWAEQLEAFEQLFQSHGYGTPDVWLPEFGWPGNRAAGDSYHPDEQAQAADLHEAYDELLHDASLSFVKAAFWFNLRDYQPGLRNPDPEFFAHYGLLHNDFSPKPAAAVWQRLAGSGR